MTPANLPQVKPYKIPLKVIIPLGTALLAILIIQTVLLLINEDPEIPEGLEELCQYECFNASYTHGKVIVEDYNETHMELSCNCYNKYNELLWEVTNEVETKH